MADQSLSPFPPRREGSEASSRALVALPLPSARTGDERPAASFLVQLIACHKRLPAFRRSGRLEPAVAALRYSPCPRSGPTRLLRSV